MTNEPQSEAFRLKKRSVGRRDLLKMGATSAVLPAVLGPATVRNRRASTTDTAERELPAGPFSIGYWNGRLGAPIGSARGLQSGDASFVRYGARLEMLGMSAGIDRAAHDRLQSLAVDIDMGPAHYRAWRFENSVARNVSSPNAFSVPVDEKKGIVFSVAAAASGLNGVPRAGGFRLSIGNESSVPKLQQGYYIIAIGERGRGLRVNWASYELVGDSTGQSIGLHRNDKPVTDFPYVLFSVNLDQENGGSIV